MNMSDTRQASNSKRCTPATMAGPDEDIPLHAEAKSTDYEVRGAQDEKPRRTFHLKSLVVKWDLLANSHHGFRENSVL